MAKKQVEITDEVLSQLYDLAGLPRNAEPELLVQRLQIGGYAIGDVIRCEKECEKIIGKDDPVGLAACKMGCKDFKLTSQIAIQAREIIMTAQ